MKPFKPKRRDDKKFLTYKRLFLITLFILVCYSWYNNCDEINVNKNSKQTSEVK
jgi:hypothetical protein